MEAVVGDGEYETGPAAHLDGLYFHAEPIATKQPRSHQSSRSRQIRPISRKDMVSPPPPSPMDRPFVGPRDDRWNGFRLFVCAHAKN